MTLIRHLLAVNIGHYDELCQFLVRSIPLSHFHLLSGYVWDQSRSRNFRSTLEMLITYYAHTLGKKHTVNYVGKNSNVFGKMYYHTKHSLNRYLSTDYQPYVLVSYPLHHPDKTMIQIRNYLSRLFISCPSLLTIKWTYAVA